MESGNQMKKQIKFKSIWLSLTFLILAAPVFIPSGSIDVINICLVLMFVLSYPLSLILGRLFFELSWFDGSIGTLYSLLFVFSILAYVQWFVIVPRLVRFVESRFFTQDVKINFSASVEAVKTLREPQTDFVSTDYQKNWYDEEKRTPVERIFDRND
jgi:hypothetical protein